MTYEIRLQHEGCEDISKIMKLNVSIVHLRTKGHRECFGFYEETTSAPKLVHKSLKISTLRMIDYACKVKERALLSEGKQS
jgi:hypothetical protein